MKKATLSVGDNVLLVPPGNSTRIRVLALLEAGSVTGPAKNLIGFARRARPVVELSVVTFRRASVSDHGLLPALAEAGIPVSIIDEWGMGDPRVFPQLSRLIRNHKPDLIQTHNSKSHFLLRMAGSRRPAPWIAFHHGFTNRNRKDRFYNRVSLWSMKGADRVITVCDAFARDLRAAGVADQRIFLRHNFVLPFQAPAASELETLRPRLGIPAGIPIMLAVGRLSQEKGHADLLEGLALIRRAEPDTEFRLVIAGDGPERPRLEQQSARLGLRNIVLMPGQQDDVRPFYAIADMVVLPSHSEGSPNVLLESMSAGLPIVATDAGGIVEIASDGVTALIVPARNPQAFADAVQRLRHDHELARRLASEARREAARYTPEAYVAAMIELYRSLLGSTAACQSAKL